jgi:hypothetical protein
MKNKLTIPKKIWKNALFKELLKVPPVSLPASNFISLKIN